MCFDKCTFFLRHSDISKKTFLNNSYSFFTVFKVERGNK